MISDSGRTVSVWMASADVPGFLPLEENLATDICIIGAGITGLTSAYLLSQLGHRVVVLDDGPIGGGETGRTTAHLSNALDDRYFELEKLVGEEGVRFAAESHTAAIKRIEDIARSEAIDCDFRRLDGYLFLAQGDERETLERELEAARRAGLDDVELLPRAPIDAVDTGVCLRFPEQGQFHPLKYLAGLARAVERLGGLIHTGTRAAQVEGGPSVEVVTTGGQRVQARAAIVATNSPISESLALHTKMAPYRTFVVGARVRADSIMPALFWDTGDPYHYVRLQHGQGTDGYDVLIVGGEDHKTGQEDDGSERFQRLEEWTRAHFPQVESFDFHWSGQIMEPVDYLAYIGRSPERGDNVYVATGDSGQGMTHGTIAGILLSDLITGRDNRWAELYEPGRISLRAAGEYAKENLNVAKQYLDYVTPEPSPEDVVIERGSGTLIQRAGKPVAAFRDEQGVLHEFSAVCRHMGCIVQWNSTERSWDCPCHGSRYTPMGRVVNGPASTDLPPVE